MSYAFYNCVSLLKLELNVENVATMSYTCYGCTKLKTIEFTDNSTTSLCTIFTHAFDGCQSLESISPLNTSMCNNMYNSL